MADIDPLHRGGASNKPSPRSPSSSRYEGTGQPNGVRTKSGTDTSGALPQYRSRKDSDELTELSATQRRSQVSGYRRALAREVLMKGSRVDSEQYVSTGKPEDTSRGNGVGVNYGTLEEYISDLQERVYLLKSRLSERESDCRRAVKASEHYFKEARCLRNDRNKLRQQIFELGGVEEGFTDYDLKQLYEATTGQTTSQLRKIFGKPTGDDHVRLGALLADGPQQLLRIYGNSQYHNIMSNALYTAVARAVDQLYCVGAITALNGSVDGASVGTDARGALSYLKIVEDALQGSSDVPPRALNVWRSSFTKVLLCLPEVKQAIELSGGEALSPEIGEIFHSIWSYISPHVPPDSKPARNAISKLIRLRAELSQKIRASLASYTFMEFEAGTLFDINTMRIADFADGDCEVKEFYRMRGESRGRRVVVGHCVFPALLKWGNEQGYDLDTQNVVCRATVLPLYEDHEIFMRHG